MSSHSTTHQRKGLALIGIFKLIKGVLLVAAAIGLHKLLHRDLQEFALHWIRLASVDPHNQWVAPFLAKLGLIDPGQLDHPAALTGACGVLFLTEGVGLLLQKRWAEYLSVIATASFLPLEVHEILRHQTAPRILLLIANGAAVAYLVAILRKTKPDSSK
ncbi:MAG: DUF2127 domain-containing protein [Verrucomicrobiota bacterium]